MSCIVYSEEVQKLLDGLPEETRQIVANDIGIWQKMNNKTSEDMPTLQELKNFIMELRKEDLTSTFSINEYVNTEGEHRGFLTKRGEELLSTTFDKEKFNKGTTKVSMYPGIGGTEIRIEFTSPTTGNSAFVIYHGSPTRKVWDLFNSNEDNITNVKDNRYWNAVNKIVPKPIRDLVESGKYSEMDTTATETDSETFIVKRTALEDYFEKEYNVLKQGRSVEYNTMQLKKAIRNSSVSFQNPFNITKISEEKREQYSKDTGITIDHIETPNSQDLGVYSPAEIVIVTSNGNRIQISPKGGYQDLDNAVSNKDIRAMIGLNYLLENYLSEHPNEVSKFIPSALSVGAKEIYKEGYDASKDAFKSNYADYIRGKQQQVIINEIEKILGGTNQAASEVKDAVQVAKRGISFEEALDGQEAIFTKEEQEQIKSTLNGRNLQVMSVSRRTDPAFFSKEVVAFLEKNSKKPFTDPTRVNVIELWTKHDGMPIQDILDACKKYKVAPMVSFSITGLGGTALEMGVMKHNDLLDRIEQLINAGSLNPVTTTVRIDPILVGITSMDDIRAIVQRSKALGIKKFVTSLVQSYGYTEGTPNDRKVISGINNALARDGKLYNWDKYYGRDSRGKVNFKPKQQYIDEIGTVLRELDSDPEITIQTCAFGIKGLQVSACLDPLIIERITGVNVMSKDGTYLRDTSRPECMCYGAHSDMFRVNEKKCYSSCAYCYAAHSGDNNLNYYNNDGTLKDNPYTRVRPKERSSSATIANQPRASLGSSKQENKIVETPSSSASETPIVTTVEEQQKVDLLFDPKVRRDRVNLIAKLFSIELDKAVEEKKRELQDQIDNAQDEQEKLSLQLQLKELTRADVIDELKPSGIFNRVYELFSGYVNDTDENRVQAELDYLYQQKGIEKYTAEKVKAAANKRAAYKLQQYKKLVDDEAVFQALAEEASSFLVFTEGLVIDPNYSAVSETNFREDTPDGQSDSDDFEEQYLSGETAKDGWMTNYRHISTSESLSQKVRSVLMKIPRLDYRGKIEKDDLGFARYIDANYVHAALIDKLKDMIDPDDMIPMLKELQNSKPWVGRIIKLLQNDETLFSQFYQDFRKDFTPYWIQRKKIMPDGTVRFETVEVNKPEGISYLLEQWRDNYESGTLLDEDSVYTKTGEVSKSNAKKGLSIVNGLNNQFARLNTDERRELLEDKDVWDNIMKVLHMIGIDANPTTLKTALTNIKSSPGITFTDPIQLLLPQLNVIFSGIAKGELDKVQKESEESSKADLLNTFDSAYSGIARLLSEVTDDAIESSVRENGKSYYSHTSPSYLGKLIKQLKNIRGDEERFNKFIDEEFKKYEWFYKNGKWLNDWLKQITESQRMREGLAHKVLLNSGKVEYDKWDSLDYTLALLSEYWGDPSGTKSNVKWAWYYVPILSDSPSAEFIRFRRYTTGDVLDEDGRKRTYDDVILDKLTDLVNQEYDRIMLVRKRGAEFLEGNSNIEPIANYDITYKNGKIDNIGGAEFKFLPALNNLKYDGESFLDGIIRLKERGTGTELKEFIRKGLRDVMEQEFENSYSTWDKVGLLDELPNGKYKYLPFQGQSQQNKKLADTLDNAKKVLGNAWNTNMELLRRNVENNKPYSTRKAEATIKQIKELLDESVRAGKLDAEQSNKIQKSLLIKNYAKEALREYFWNSTLATSQIIQLTTTDLAYYKNLEDFQKRFKEVHSPTVKLNTKATYKGDRIGRDWERTIILKDSEIVSDVVDGIKEIIMEKHKKGELSDYDAASILSKYGYSNHTVEGKKYVKIGSVMVKTSKVNVADAQAYRSISSYRAILGMSGQWTDEMEEAYNHFRDGVWSIADFNIIWQTKKPFLYTQIEKLAGYKKKQVPVIDKKTGTQKADEQGNPIFTEVDDTSKPIYQKVPVQHKNSEFLLLAMHELIAGPLGKSSKLRAINRFMEQHNIDVVQFESTTKVGRQGTIDLSDVHSEKDIIQKLKEETGAGTAYENPNKVHKVPYADYGIATATPEHLIGKTQLVGTQIRKLIAADIPSDAIIEIDGKKMTKQEWIDLYNKINTENIIESFSQISEVFKDPKEIEKILLDEIRRNPRYGNDLKRACTLTDKGTFNIPLYDPVQSQRVQTLLNSIIKSRITKQKIKGGSALQVSDYGLTDQLHIVFEGEGENKRIKYIECYMPAYSKDFYEPLMDPKTHQLDVTRLPEDLRKLIGYRIPTESHYSMAPLYIKGFLPQQNGSAIMLPAEITTIAGSDFDADKLYLMLPEFEVFKYDKRAARRDFAKANAAFNSMLDKFSGNQLLEDTLSLDNDDFKEWYNKNKDKYKLARPIIRKVKYDHNKSVQDNSREARNNLLIDMMFGILTNPSTASKILNPGGFSYQKRAARIVTLLNSLTEDQLKKILQENGIELNKTVTVNGEIQSKSIASYLFDLDEDLLDDLASKYKESKNPLSPTTQVYLHQQNMSGAQLISIYANHNANHALMQYTELGLNRFGRFMLNGKTLTSLHSIVNANNEIISKNTAGFLAAAVDNVKDPVLAALNQNLFTADATMLLSRLGYNPIEIGLLMSQPIIMEMTQAYFRQSKQGKSKKDVISEIISKYRRRAGLHGTASYDDYKNHSFSMDELGANILDYNSIKNSNSTDSRVIDFYRKQSMVGYLFERVMASADALSSLTQATRADTPNGAAGPTIADTMLKIQKLQDFTLEAKKSKEFPLQNAIVLQTGLISPGDSIDTIRQKLLNSKLPYLQAFYSLGIEASMQMMGNYFPQFTQPFIKVIDKLREKTKSGKLDVNTMNNIYNDLLAYIMSKTEFFGKEGDRDYFINSFPDKFNSIIANNPDIAELEFIKRLKVVRANQHNPVSTIIFKNVGRLTPILRERYMRDWEYLLHMDNPVAQKLALDLFKYSYFRNGFAFGPSTFIHLAPTALRRVVPDYIKTLESLLTSEDSYSDFVEQYVYNHLDNRRLVPAISDDSTVKFTDEKNNVKDEVAFVIGENSDPNDLKIVKRTQTIGGVKQYECLDYIGKRIGNKWVYYRHTGSTIDAFNQQVETYTRIQPLGHTNSFIEYEYGKEVSEMESVIKKANTEYSPDELAAAGFDTGESQVDLDSAPKYDEDYQDSVDQAVRDAYKQVYGEQLTEEKSQDKDITKYTPNTETPDAEGQKICGASTIKD